MRLPKGASAIGLAMMSLASMANAYQSALHACPAPCDSVSGDWTVYTSVNRLQYCKEPMLLDFSLHPGLDEEDRVTKLFACTSNNMTSNTITSGAPSGAQNSARGHHAISHKRFHNRDIHSTCISGEEQKISLDLITDSDPGSVSVNVLQTIVERVQNHLGNTSHCDTTSVFGYYNGVAVGVYVGSAIDNPKSTSSLFQRFYEQIPRGQHAKSMVMQRCRDVSNADYTIGLAVDTTGDLTSVQKSVHSWSKGQCASTDGVNTKIDGVPVLEKAMGRVLNSNSTVGGEHISKRSDCRTINVIGGDTCSSLAKKCGISPNDFTKYNSAKTLCSTLAAGQSVCCSAGSLPDIRPKPNKDGSCHTYTVQAHDVCDSIAASNGLKASDISDFNDKTTWGWFGCGNLQLKSLICLSKGDPPMPAPVSNAQCGPIVAGTKKPTNGTALADLNPCPLNSCCDIWGQCGITPEYCTNITGPTGNPGTAPKYKNGCISNCGTNITKSRYTPETFMKVGYYETWNYDRPCLNLRVADVGVNEYTHIHWAFAEITEDFDIKINDTYNQWKDFIAMDPANSGKFIDNINNFVKKNGLNGIDFDWEYPGATDLPGIPKGLASDGTTYLNFIKKMKLNFPFDKTVSIAAPASYWYLKSFLIDEMAKSLDYIVYMTYDLHGQWDYGKQWTQEGCPHGDCLRSQVNLTETKYSLAMLTKAGVDSNKVFVGVPTYGRSFGMTDESCTGPNCHYTGTNSVSNAKEGRCTKTAGIIANAEINEILAIGNQTKVYYDAGSDSNIIVWDNTWASFMDGDTMKSRTSFYKDFNFGGTVEWAVDLNKFTDDDNNYDDSWDEPPVPKLAACTETFHSIEALGNASSTIPEHCVTQYTLQTLSDSLSAAMKNYTDLMNDGYDAKFKIYADTVAENAGASVHDFVYQNGNKYFTCKVDEDTICCDQCHANKNTYNCDLCWSDSACYTSCDSLACQQSHGFGHPKLVYKRKSETEPCPPDYSKRFRKDRDHPESVHWSLDDSKATKFWADLYTNTGINQSHIQFGQYTRQKTCGPSVKSDDDCWKTGYDYNIPLPKGYDASEVSNPKDTAKKGLDRAGSLKPQLSTALFQMATDTWVGDGMDLIDSISLPILMIVSAVQEMSAVEKIAEKLSAEEKKLKETEIIGGFLTAILFMVPIAGEVLGTIEGLADVGLVLSIAGTAADIGTGVADIVKNPNNAALDIMNIVFDAGFLAGATKASKAAKLRREMKEADIAKLGDKVSSGLKSVDKLTGKCS
ncbi:killer toxin alpha/beta [Penicillium verrucosum]|uniref:killer toxin alpha/beta n=1 Tax=Penicillium verrucosum TaxID=60171 RepID=UPI002545AF36|nr:killer toxin alpha/beta [Penicillium verrucosum]KAJ5926897.1 killer toxin alpha/beta [Penicillium verrucosum]